MQEIKMLNKPIIADVENSDNGSNSEQPSVDTQNPFYSTSGSSPTSATLTDDGNAERLVAKYGEELRYVHEWRTWLVWGGHSWKQDASGAEVMARATSIAKSIYAEAVTATTMEERDAIVKWARRSLSRERLNAMIDLAKSKRTVQARSEHFDQQPHLLNALNGTIDLQSGKLLPHRQEDLLTKSIDIEYDPQAEAPVFKKFIEQIFDDNEEIVSFIQRAVGYSLTGETSEQVMFVLYGNGSNGKSTLINIFLDLLGDLAMQTPTSTLTVKRGETIPNDVASIRGKRLVAASEMDEGKRLSEALVKQLTGSDRVSARFMRGEWFDFRPTGKIWLSTNHKPIIRGADEGIWRRIRLIPFNVQFHDDTPENAHLPSERRKDRNLPARLREELPGILRWAVEGAVAWYRDGLTTPAEVMEATNDYRSEMDLLANFLDEACNVSPDAKAQSSELYQSYRQWCEANGVFPLNHTNFSLRLKERGFEKRKSNGRFVYIGVGLKAAGLPLPPASRSAEYADSAKDDVGGFAWDAGVKVARSYYEVEDGIPM